MYSVTGGHLSASMEENDDLSACMIIPYAACSLFYHPPFGGLVLSHIVPVIPHDGMDDP